MTTTHQPSVPCPHSLSATLAIGAISVLAAAVLAACPPAVPDAQATPAAASQVPTVPVAPVRSAAIEARPTQVARVEAASQVKLSARVSGPIAEAMVLVVLVVLVVLREAALAATKDVTGPILLITTVRFTAIGKIA